MEVSGLLGQCYGKSLSGDVEESETECPQCFSNEIASLEDMPHSSHMILEKSLSKGGMAVSSMKVKDDSEIHLRKVAKSTHLSPDIFSFLE